MPLQFEPTRLSGLMMIHSHAALDERGFYRKYYEKNAFAAHGIAIEFTESSDIRSRKGVLRGLHYQTRCSQAKLLHVLSGAIFDVAVDLRPHSPTFGQWQSFYLTGEEHRALLLPEQFAHGFLALEENTVFSYQCSGEYLPEACGGIAWNDPDLAIPWPLDRAGNPILSEKDRRLPSLAQYRQQMEACGALGKGGESR